jgi:hypothetical protein
MERFFEAQGRCPRVRANKLQLKLRAESSPMNESELSRPPALGMLIALRKQGYDNRVIFFENRLELPGFCAHETMCRSLGIICLGAKPRETDRDAASNCLTIRPAGFRAQEKHLITVIAGRLPGGHLCTVQVDLGLTERRSDLHSRHRAIAFAYTGEPRDSEPAI